MKLHSTHGNKRMRLHTRAFRLSLFAGWVMQRDWILERNKENNVLYKSIAPEYPHLSRYSEEFIRD